MAARQGIGILLMLVIVFSAGQPFAAPAQRQDAPRHLYDRIMEEFKHRDYEKARLMFDRVIDQYPESPEAEVARKAVEALSPSEEPSTSSPQLQSERSND